MEPVFLDFIFGGCVIKDLYNLYNKIIVKFIVFIFILYQFVLCVSLLSLKCICSFVTVTFSINKGYYLLLFIR